MNHFWWTAIHEFVESFLPKSAKENVIRHMTSCINLLSPKLSWSPMLIEHHTGHLIESSILPLQDTILRRDIRCQVLMLKTKITAKGIKLRVSKLCATVTVYSSNDFSMPNIFQPQDC
jgi:hypothetical protein